MADSPRDRDQFLPSSSANFSSLSLAQHYIPDKLAVHPARWGSDARKTSRKAVGGWGAAAGRARDDGHGEKGNGVLFKPEYHSDGFSTAISSPAGDPFRARGMVMGPPSSGHRNRKWGAGRLAWGKDSGGNVALGAGDYEDDDGVDLSSDNYSRWAGQGGEGVGADRHHGHPSHNAPSSSSKTRGEAGQRVSFFTRLLGVQLRRKDGRGRWNRFKWILVVLNSVLTAYAIIGFVAVLLVWTGMYNETKVLILVNRTELILSMTAMCLCLITAYLGWAGLMLNNRSFLAIYTLLLWISLIFIVAPGYIAYKQRTFNLSGKINRVWSRRLSLDSRRTVQVVLQCCGYYSPSIEAAADGARCFARSMLPGCKGKLYDFERTALQYIYVCSFSIVPMHLSLILATLLCADHITYRFGKGVTPKEYRVDDTVVQHALLQQSHTTPPMPPTKDDLDGSHTPLSEPRPPFWQQKHGSPSGSTTT